MIEASALRVGTVFEDGGSRYEVMKFQLHKTAMEEAVCRIKAKDLKTGAIIDKSYRTSAKLKDIAVERREKTFLYFEGDLAYFMDMETFETVPFLKSKLGNAAKFLTENLEVEALYGDDDLLDVVLPAHVTLEVVVAPPGIRGDSATNPTKPVTLQNGMICQAPVFIKAGDKIKVDVESGKYVERV